MRIIVAGLGVLIVILIGVVGLAAPQRLRAVFASSSSRTRFVAAITVRLVIGAFLWIAADQLRFPDVVRIIAAISFFAAVLILVMGRERLNRLVDWWLSRPDGLLRLSALFAATFGGFLIYVAS